ncbi:MAG: hypothetical protein ABW184_15440 [Sphingobium sp.]
MFAILGAIVFFGAAVFAAVVITEMTRGYWPAITAAWRTEPMPRTAPTAVRRRRRLVSRSFTPRRLERARAAA